MHPLIKCAAFSTIVLAHSPSAVTFSALPKEG
jgi:hypothetical protein